MQKNGMYIQQNDSGFGIYKTLLMMMVEKKRTGTDLMIAPNFIFILLRFCFSYASGGFFIWRQTKKKIFCESTRSERWDNYESEYG